MKKCSSKKRITRDRIYSQKSRSFESKGPISKKLPRACPSGRRAWHLAKRLKYQKIKDRKI